MPNFNVDIPPIPSNPLHQKFLQELFANKVQSFLQYTFNCFVFSAENKAISNTFWNIATDELLHTKTLGFALAKLGKTPIFCKENGTPITTRSILSNTTIKPTINNCVQQKENNIIFIKTILAKLSDVSTKNLVRGILKNEECHLEILKNIDKIIKNGTNYLQS